MPRAVVKLSLAPEIPPDWWADEFRTRQSELRSRLMARLPKVGRALTASEIRQNLTSSVFRTREIKHSLDLLVSQGVLRCFDKTEPHSRCGFGTTTRTLTYYELTEQA